MFRLIDELFTQCEETKGIIIGFYYMQRVLLTTGGTGGHIFPALAVAEALRKFYPNIEILFVGSDYGPERELVTKAGINFIGLPVRGFIGRGLKSLTASFIMFGAIKKSIKIIKDFKPDLAMGFGSYASFAPLLAAKICKIPTALHEQNAVMGMSNKLLGKLVNKVFLSMPIEFPVSIKGIKLFSTEKCILIGNLVRSAISGIGENEHDFTTKKLLVLGGSQGAKSLNDFIVKNIDNLDSQGITILHQTGIKDFDRVKAAYEAKGINTQNLMPFIVDMPKVYDMADLVLCRAGASTVTELAAVGKGAIFVPFPYATHDHQNYNARLLADIGAAKVYQEKDIDSENLIQEVINLLNSPNLLEQMAKLARTKHCENVSQELVNNLNLLIKHSE